MQNDNNIQIKNDNIPDIYLQNIQLSDANQTYVDWLNDPEINQYLETRHYSQDIDSIVEFIKAMQANPNEHLFTIRTTDDNKHIGNIKVGGINAIHQIGEVSLFIGDKTTWGKGYATQAIQLISQYSFETLSLRKLTAGAYSPNKGSTKAFLKAGYVNDGILTDHYLFNGKPCNLVQVCMFNKNTI